VARRTEFLATRRPIASDEKQSSKGLNAINARLSISLGNYVKQIRSKDMNRAKYDEKLRELRSKGFSVSANVLDDTVDGIETTFELAVDNTAKCVYPMRIHNPTTEADGKLLLSKIGWTGILAEYRHGHDLTCRATAKSPMGKATAMKLAMAYVAKVKDFATFQRLGGNVEAWVAYYRENHEKINSGEPAEATT